MKTSKSTWVGQLLFISKLGVMVLGVLALISMPQIVQIAHAQAHSNHFHAFSHAIGYLAENENRTNEQKVYVNKDADTNSNIVIASEEKTILACPQKTDEADNR
jgi:Tfp pilus assembly protein FimT